MYICCYTFIYVWVVSFCVCIFFAHRRTSFNLLHISAFIQVHVLQSCIDVYTCYILLSSNVQLTCMLSNVQQYYIVLYNRMYIVVDVITYCIHYNMLYNDVHSLIHVTMLCTCHATMCNMLHTVMSMSTRYAIILLR